MGGAATESALLKAGERAPGFELEGRPGERVTLEEFRGRPVVVFFYPADWSPVCGEQVVLYNEVLEEIEELGARIVGISVDSAWCHAAFAEKKKLRYPILADFEPKGEVARRYGVYRAGEGVSERAIFVIDGEGVIRWSHLSPIEVNPGADGIIRVLEEIRDGGKT